MAEGTEQIEWIALRNIVPGENPRTVRPSRERILDYARSIAHCGLLVPLLAERRDGACHLLAGHTRLAALKELKENRSLRELAQRNGIDVDHVPVRFFNGNAQRLLLLPIIENNFHDLMNDVDLAQRVKLLLDAGTDPAMLEHFFGRTPYKRLLEVLKLPKHAQQLIKDGKLSSTTALKIAKEIPRPDALVRKLIRTSKKVDELCLNGRRKLPRVTEGVLTGKQTTMRVVNEVAALVCAQEWKCAKGTLRADDPFFTLLHGLQHGMKSAGIVEALRDGRTIEAPPKKKRGRKPKNKGTT